MIYLSLRWLFSWIDWGDGGAAGKLKRVQGTTRSRHDLSLMRGNQKDHYGSCAHNTEREQMALPCIAKEKTVLFNGDE